jgi:hypothetical protein
MDWQNLINEQKIIFWMIIKKLLIFSKNETTLEESINFLTKVEEQKKNAFFYQLSKTEVFSKIYQDFTENLIKDFKKNCFSSFFFNNEMLLPNLDFKCFFRTIKMENELKNFDFRKETGNSNHFDDLFVKDEIKQKKVCIRNQLDNYVHKMDEKFWINFVKKREKYFDFFAEIINEIRLKDEFSFLLLKVPFLNIITLSLGKWFKLIRYSHETEFHCWMMRFLETVMEFSTILKKNIKIKKILHEKNFLEMKQLLIHGYTAIYLRMKKLLQSNLEAFFKAYLFKNTKKNFYFKEEFFKILIEFYKIYQEKYFDSNKRNRIEKGKKINNKLLFICTNVFIQVNLSKNKIHFSFRF